MIKRRVWGVVLILLAAPALSRAAERWNILFCIADDASYPHMGAYGCSWVKTPAFDRVAREGILFTRCYTPNAKCAPSRACILTGRNSWQLEEAANHVPHFPAKFKTYAETLACHGYHVGFTGKGYAGRRASIGGKPRQLGGRPYQANRTKPPHQRHRQLRLRGEFPGLSPSPAGSGSRSASVRRVRAAPRL